MVDHTYDGVGALSRVDSLVDQVVHLSRDGLATHTEDGALSWCQEIHGARLLRIVGYRHLKTVVGMDRSAVVMLVVEGRCRQQ